MKTSLLLLGIGAVMAIGLGVLCCKDPAEAKVDVLVGSKVSAQSGSYQAVYIDIDYRQDILYGKRLDYSDPTKLVVRIREGFDTQSRTWLSEDAHGFSSSFEIEQIAPSGKDKFYLLGTATNGDDVIEYWKRKNVGMPGGQSGYVLKRTEIYRGAFLEIDRIGADPEGRYLLLVHGNNPKKLSRMTLPHGDIVDLLFDSTTEPHLEVAGDPFVMQHAIEGRVWTLAGGDASSGRLVLWDHTNDGIIDAWAEVYRNTYDNNYGYLAPPGTWTDDFVRSAEFPKSW